MKLHAVLSLLILLCSITITEAQERFPDPGYVFDDSEVPRIDIFLNSDSLEQLLLPENRDSRHEYPATFYFKKGDQVDTIQNVGFRLRGNTSRSAQKKSFKISFNAFESGKKYHGLEKMNLNGEHNDPTITRSKMCWDMYRQAAIPASRSNHIELYVNSIYRGVYINVEHIDEEFCQLRYGGEGNLYKCLWPADMKYRGGDPLQYAEPESWGRQAYELKTNLDEYDYSDLADLIYTLNITGPNDFVCELESRFEVDDYLRTIAMDILVSNWDGPIVNKNNFYLYSNPRTGKFHYIPYDLDNTFGIDWFGVDWANTTIYDWSSYSGEDRPLYDKIMSVPEYRDRLSFYFNQFIQDFFNVEVQESRIEELRDAIGPLRSNDSFSSSDYGWNLNDFNTSFDTGIGSHVDYGLKDYISSRTSSVESELELNNIVPYAVKINAKRSTAAITINYAFEDDEDFELSLIYSIDGGTEQTVALSHSGDYDIAYDADAEILQYRFEVNDGTHQRSYPYCGEYEVSLFREAIPTLVINEIMASNESAYVDEAGEYNDWIELYNYGTESVALGKLYLSDKSDNPTKWQFPEYSLGPNEYIIIWADEDGEQGDFHANFKLSASGEFIGLFDSDDNANQVIDSLSFGAQTTDISLARMPNGTGPFELDDNHSAGENNDINSSIEDSLIDDVRIHPNPTNGLILIESNIVWQRLTVLSIEGKVILERNYTPVLDLSDLTEGMYLLQFSNLERSIFKELVKL